MTRKCSFRFMLIDEYGAAYVITQDLRRRRNIITGTLYFPEHHSPCFYDIAREYGCSVLVREKR